MLILFNPLLFQVVVDPSLSPFIPTITIVCCGRHLSRMQPFSLIPNLHRARTFFIFVSMTAPSGKAKTSSVGRAATFPEREGKDLFRRQSRHLPRNGRQNPLPSTKPPPSPKGKAFCRERPILFQGKLQRFLYSLKSCEFISLSCFSCFSCLFQLT